MEHDQESNLRQENLDTIIDKSDIRTPGIGGRIFFQEKEFSLTERRRSPVLKSEFHQSTAPSDRNGTKQISQ